RTLRVGGSTCCIVFTHSTGSCNVSLEGERVRPLLFELPDWPRAERSSLSIPRCRLCSRARYYRRRLGASVNTASTFQVRKDLQYADGFCQRISTMSLADPGVSQNPRMAEEATASESMGMGRLGPSAMGHAHTVTNRWSIKDTW